ncbi:MAG TPA: 2-succinyl-5-enolpyruvyl-6-hydroxy-3-cyclohexene-1-carboxylic-acid synthase, partial [Acidimicrobiales bacterium]|nr:2-succinyl-5-enolpyruvyl-6-hydroxy-3-cyclohexene-1-carboxylic-acid synthase [Acidimicrobiales bacterium]
MAPPPADDPPADDPPADAAAGGGPPRTAAATFCATLVDEWVRAGIADVVVAPGSRSTPLALAVAHDGRVRVHVHHDERSAGFLALGLGLATGRPAPVITTSGTAAVELHPAVVEAHQARVPMICCTADRPPELHHVGAPQTVDQVHLYGRAVRWFADPGVPDAAAASSWRSLAARSVAEALGPPAGPVQLNLPFRDPLVGSPGPLPEGRADGGPWHRHVAQAERHPALDAVHEIVTGRRGVIVAGWGVDDPGAVHRLAAVLGWPVLADPRSGCRTPDPATVAHADALLRVGAMAERFRPEVVLQLGAPPASKVVGQWLAASGARHVVVDPDGAWLDPDRRADVVVAGAVGAVCDALATAGPERAAEPWAPTWAAAEAAAASAIADALAGHDGPTEPGIARDVVAVVPDHGALVVSSSMPVRDVEWYAAPRTGGRVLSNRGANGIDGVVSTAVGLAVSGTPTVLLIGDVALLHDTNGLLGLAGRVADLVIVVVDNDGGGIFSFLPQARQLDDATFERLFGTPHGVDVAALARVHGLPATVVARGHEVGPAVVDALALGGARVIVARTDRR